MKAIEKHPLSDGYPPTWASAWGQDRCGVWVEVEVGPVVQRLRWIPGGVFWMGSPDDEAGRADWEWPRHQVELAEGFWLADTPCTQELWQEVMGSNPSEFISPRRPVESISWDDCQQFLASLNERIPGLAAQLPTEAQWERACRAGTETPNWVGDLEVLGENNAPLLDSIAWYGGNSG
ncbi:MAG: formylglycine-generating enzyme family protein, partial [Acidobacteriota bacterium]